MRMHCAEANKQEEVVEMAEEKKGQTEVFDSFESNVQNEISVDEAKAQEAEAKEVRAAEGE